MKFTIKNVLILFFILSLSIKCQTEIQEKDFEISIVELKEKIEKDSNLVVLDVRTAGELIGKLGQIDGAIHIPLSELSQRIDELEIYKSHLIAVVCRMGVRSARATIILREKGYQARNIKGGMIAFRDK